MTRPKESKRGERRISGTAFAALLLLAAGLTTQLWLPLLVPSSTVISDAELADEELKSVLVSESRVALARGRSSPDWPWYGRAKPRQPIMPLIKWQAASALPGAPDQVALRPGGGLLALSSGNLVEISPAGQTRALGMVDIELTFPDGAWAANGDFLMTGWLEAGLYDRDGRLLWEIERTDMADLDNLIGVALRPTLSSSLLAFGDSPYGRRHNGYLLEVPREGLSQVQREQQMHGLVRFAAGHAGRSFCVISDDPLKPGLELRCISQTLETLWSFEVAESASDSQLFPQADGSLLMSALSPKSGSGTIFAFDPSGKLDWQTQVLTMPEARHELELGKNVVWLFASGMTASKLEALDFEHGQVASETSLDYGLGAHILTLPDDSAILGFAGTQFGSPGMLRGLVCMESQGKARWSLQAADGVTQYGIAGNKGFVYLLGRRTLYTFKEDGTDLKLWTVDGSDAVKLLQAPEGPYLFMFNGDVALLDSPP